MRKPKKNLVAPGSTLTWGKLEDMYGTALAQAVQDLEPVTAQEAATMVSTFQILSAARRPMLPTERSECERLRRKPILAAAAVRCAELHRTEQIKPGHLLLRDAVTMVQELCMESGDAEPIGRLDDWVWGPTGPPCEDGSAPSGETPLQRWERARVDHRHRMERRSARSVPGSHRHSRQADPRRQRRLAGSDGRSR